MMLIHKLIGAAICTGALFSIAPDAMPWYGAFCIGGASWNVLVYLAGVVQMTRRTSCQTFGCKALAPAGRSYCRQCRTMRQRARGAGRDPDAMSWRQLDAAFWNVKEKANA